MGASAARESKTKQGPRRSFRSKLLSKRVREARSADLLRRAIRNDFPFGMHFTKRGAERRAAQLGNSRRNKVLEKNSVRLYFPNGVREARGADLLRRTIRNYFPFGMHFTKRGG